MLRKLIDDIRSRPVKVSFLKERLPKDVPVLSYKQLAGKHRSELFKNRSAIVVIIPLVGTKFGHFVVLLKRDKHISYFSSLGNSPFDELKKLHEPRRIFEELLGKNYTYNRDKLQSNKVDTQTCWIWILLRIKFKDLKLRDFVKLFNSRINLSTPDEIATVMCLSLIY